MSDLILALDFGGTKHAAGLLQVGASAWRAHERIFSSPGADRDSDLSAVTELARRLLNGATPAAIGVSFGGPVDYDRGLVRLSHHVPGWKNTPLRELLQTSFNAPTQVDNDANAAAIGEWRFGAGRGPGRTLNSLLYVTISTGVGGGWILNGQVWRGANNMAGEIGHTVVDPSGPLCLCGKRGCVERLASGPYMAADVALALVQDPQRSPLLRDLVQGDLHAINGEVISQAAAQGDQLAQEILDRGAHALGVGLGNAANLVNPQRIVLGGGVTKAGKQFWSVLRRSARYTALPEVDVEIVPAELGDDAPLWGAAALAADLLS